MSEHLLRIIESKRAFRSNLAALPFAEKIALLERLRQRVLLISVNRITPHDDQG